MEEEGFSFFCFTRKVAVGRQDMTSEDVDDGTAPVTDHRFGEVQEVGHVHNIIQLIIINAVIDGGKHKEPKNCIVGSRLGNTDIIIAAASSIGLRNRETIVLKITIYIVSAVTPGKSRFCY